MAGIGLKRVVVDVVEVVVVDRMKMGRDWNVDGDMEVDRKFAGVDSKKMKKDLGRRMFGNRRDLVIVERKNPRNHPSCETEQDQNHAILVNKIIAGM